MRSLKIAICTSGEPVSPSCWAYLSISSAFLSFDKLIYSSNRFSTSPDSRRADYVELPSRTLIDYSGCMDQCKSVFDKKGDDGLRLCCLRRGQIGRAH